MVADMTPRYPTSFGRWLSAADFALGKVDQVAILGDPADERTQALINVLRNSYHPNMVVAACSYPPQEGAPALLNGRPLLEGQPTAYVCQGFCLLYTSDAADEEDSV